MTVPGPMLLDVDRGGPDFPLWAGHQCHSWPENSPKIGDLRRRSPNSLVLGLVVNTHNWWAGKKVLVSSKWVERVSWSERKVFVDLRRETIKQSPEYAEEAPVTRDYETGLHLHYNRLGYWIDEAAAVAHSAV